MGYALILAGSLDYKLLVLPDVLLLPSLYIKIEYTEIYFYLI